MLVLHNSACMITTSEPFAVICRPLLAPGSLLLTELGLLPLQVFWWRQNLQFWNGLAVLLVGSLYHTVCLDNLTDAFQKGACNHWQHVCVQ